MNDISVKIVDFGKEQSGAEIVAPVNNVVENEVDPLAIDEAKVREAAEVVEAVECDNPEKPEVQETVESCDQNAKDENLSVKLDLASEELRLQSQQIKEDLLKEDVISLSSTIEDPAEEPENFQNGADLETSPQPEVEQTPEPAPEDEPMIVDALEVPEVVKAPVVPIVPEVPVVPVPETAPVVPVAQAIPIVSSITVAQTVPVAPTTSVADTIQVASRSVAGPALFSPVTAETVAPSLPISVPVPTALVEAPEPIAQTPLVTSSIPPAVITETVLKAPAIPIAPTVPIAHTVQAAPIVPIAPIISTPPPVQLTVPVAPAVSVTSTVTKVTTPIASTITETPTIRAALATPPIILEVPKVKETSPVKEVWEPAKEEEVKLLERIVEKVVEADVEMIEAPIKVKTEENLTGKPVQTINGDAAKEEHTTKRRLSEEAETESPLKKLCQEVEKTFPHHDTMINDYIQTATKNNIDEIQRHTEQLLSEIQTLRELAQKKEHEWNNILHLKKVKEEILLRLLRRKQVLSFEKAADVNGSDRTDPFDYLNQAKNLAIDKSDEISGLSLKPPCSTMNPIIQAPVMPVTSHFNPMVGLPPPYDKAAHMQAMPKPVFPQPLMLPGPTMPGFPRDMNGQLPTGYGLPMGRQGPTKDVKSIIADYRQRNPDITPRRGRRMKSILNPNMMNNPRNIAPKMMDNMNNYNNLNNLNMLFNNLDMNQKAMLERLQQIQAGALPNGVSFKDVLVQFANMQQGGMPSMPGLPSRPPEPAPVPVPAPARPEHHAPRPERRRERHEPQILNKQPERMTPPPRLPPPPPYPEISLLPVSSAPDTGTSSAQNSLLHGILTKNCGEITITPVQPTPPPPDAPPEKAEEVVQLDDEESPASEGSAAASPADGGRLVIDEGSGADDAPPCQGCRRRAAQFVCAGCANQWYCSRDCQVAAWDDHSEMCSG